MSLIQKHHRLLFYGFWLFLGLMQSGLTELQDDEAYYWVYSRFLDWGYFDHPPMIAVLVKMGYAIFPNELGVRLFPLLLHLLSLLIIENLLDKKSPLLFYGIMLSIAALQLSGFIAVPDNPLIFFTALFFLCYKRFLENNTLFNTFLLGLATAFLFYSKYHAVLIVAFTLLSNRKLWLNYKTYLAGLVGLVLFLPHLWWQYQHNWVSFRYHLFESNVSSWKFSYTLDYLVGQLLLAGPLAGIILFPAAFGYKVTNPMERALRYTLFGIYLFFFAMSFRGQVEGNWTSPALVPLVVLAHQALTSKLKLQKWLFRLLPVTLLLVLVGRLVMIADVVPLKAVRSRYHSWKDWPSEMRDRTNGLPIVFRNSYQRASKYWFYSGQTTYSENSYKARKNNFNYWPLEDSLLGKPVFVLDIYDMWWFPDSLKTPIGWVGYKFDTALLSFAKINIHTDREKIRLKVNDSLKLTCTFSMPDSYSKFIAEHPDPLDSVRIGVFNSKGWMSDIFTDIRLEEMKAGNKKNITVWPGLPRGDYYLRFAINRGFSLPTHNSDKIALVIE